MDKQLVDDQGALVIAASEESSPHDFDFLIGSWLVSNHKLKSRLTGCKDWSDFEFTSVTRSILNGFGNVDETGSTLRLFNPESRLWSIYGAGNGAVSLDLLSGSFKGAIGDFYGHD